MANDLVEIGEQLVGTGQPCFIIAEAGVNHNGDMQLGIELIDAAVEAGADAVKFQTFQADRLAITNTAQAAYAAENVGERLSHYDMLKSLELSDADHRLLQDHCTKRGITFLSSPFDELSADYLRTLNVPAFKIPSGELTNIPYLGHIASKGLPVIVSTGMATIDEVEAAVRAIEAQGNQRYVLLHCVSNYPADPADANLLAMGAMRSAFKCLVGFSDHSPGSEISIGAVALGACVIEKHLTLDRTLPGPDHKASEEPADFAALVRGIRTIEAAMGTGIKEPSAAEAATAEVARKSLVTSLALSAGTVLTEAMIAIKRPGTGLAPGERDAVVGRILKVDVAKDTLLTMEMLR